MSVGVQRGTPCLWALVDDDAVSFGRTILMRGTGHPCDGLMGSGSGFGARFLGTIQMYGGDLVLHVFEESWK